MGARILFLPYRLLQRFQKLGRLLGLMNPSASEDTTRTGHSRLATLTAPYKAIVRLSPLRYRRTTASSTSMRKYIGAFRPTRRIGASQLKHGRRVSVTRCRVCIGNITPHLQRREGRALASYYLSKSVIGFDHHPPIFTLPLVGFSVQRAIFGNAPVCIRFLPC